MVPGWDTFQAPGKSRCRTSLQGHTLKPDGTVVAGGCGGNLSRAQTLLGYGVAEEEVDCLTLGNHFAPCRPSELMETAFPKSCFFLWVQST